MTKTAAKPALVTGRKPVKSSPMDQARENVKERLAELFKAFLADALPEEQQFMLAVLGDWEVNSTGNKRGPEDLEVPIYSACQLNLTGKALIEVPFYHHEKVNAFVASLAVGDCLASLESA